MASQVGLRPSALRFYEEAGLLPEAERVGGKRHYPATVLERLAVIRFLQDAGFSVGEIRELFASPPDGAAKERWRALARRKLTEVDALVGQALAVKRLLEEALRCDCLDPESCTLLREQDHDPRARPSGALLAPALAARTARAGARGGNRPRRSSD